MEYVHLLLFIVGALLAISSLPSPKRWPRLLFGVAAMVAAILIQANV